jgi:cell wall assembly regulator SMI1
MNNIISKIKEQLAPYIPELNNSFNLPAIEQELLEAENTIGFKLPEDLRELYKIHNGQSGQSNLFLGLPFLSLQDALDEWKIWNDVAKDNVSSLDDNIISFPEGCIKEVYVNTHHFPISKDYGGNNISIDCDPDTNGTTGQVINTGRDEEKRYVIAKSVTDFFRFMLHHIETGNFTVKRQEDYISWSLKEPASGHFFDTLKNLYLPYGNTRKTENIDEEPFSKWFNALPSDWKDFINMQCEEPSDWNAIKKTSTLRFLKYNFTNLSPLDKFTGLRELILSGNSCSDLTPLKNLSSLKKLYLAQTPIASIESIPDLPNLAQLSLYKTNINSLKGIGKLKNLKSLSIESTAITSFDELTTNKKLTELDISKNTFKSFDALSEFRNLKDLNLSETNFKDLNLLSGLKKLNSLNLFDTKIEDFSPLTQLQNLKSITCSQDDSLTIKKLIGHDIIYTICRKVEKKKTKKGHFLSLFDKK